MTILLLLLLAACQVTPSPTPTPTETALQGRIAFVSDRDGTLQLYVMNADGSGVTRLTEWPDRDSVPVWAPECARIAFGTQIGGGHFYVYQMEGEKGEQTRLQGFARLRGLPAWSPDWGRIVFDSSADGRSDIFLMSSDGGDRIRLTDDAAYDCCVAWARMGRRSPSTSVARMAPGST